MGLGSDPSAQNVLCLDHQALVYGAGGLFLYFLLLSIYRVTLHPLAKYPGPLGYRISVWPLVYQCYKGNRHLHSLRDHEKYGPVVRTSPDTLSFSSPTALHQIYGSRAVNVRKSKFYETLDSGPGGSTTHTEIDKEKHAARRRILSYAFSEAAIREAEVLIIGQVRKLVALVGPNGASTREVEGDPQDEDDGGWSPPRKMSKWLNWLAYDVMGNFVFGKSYDCLEDDRHRRMPDLMTEGTKFGYWFAYLPSVAILRPFATSWFVTWLGGQTARDNAELVDYAIAQFEERAALEKRRQEAKDSSAPKDLMHYLLNNADPKTGLRPTEEELKGDTLSLIGAGADTIATSLAATLFYLSRNPSALARASSEVRAAFQHLDHVRSGPKLDSCAYLNACIEEALRLSPAVAASLPREVLKGGIAIDGHWVPEGTIVGVPAYVVQHDEHIFPDPWSFKPERWIATSGPENAATFSAEDVKRAREAMCPFSLGSRGCIGKPVAYLEMRITLVALLLTYDLKEVEGPGRIGGGAVELEEGRQRVDEYQIFDCFGADRDGPVLRFRERNRSQGKR